MDWQERLVGLSLWSRTLISDQRLQRIQQPQCLLPSTLLHSSDDHWNRHGDLLLVRYGKKVYIDVSCTRPTSASSLQYHSAATHSPLVSTIVRRAEEGNTLQSQQRTTTSSFHSSVRPTAAWAMTSFECCATSPLMLLDSRRRSSFATLTPLSVALQRQRNCRAHRTTAQYAAAERA